MKPRLTALACTLALAASAAHADAAPDTDSASDLLRATKRGLLPLIATTYAGPCKGALRGPIGVAADGVLQAGSLTRDLLAPEVMLEVRHAIVKGKPGPASVDTRVFDDFRLQLEQGPSTRASLSVGGATTECRVKHSGAPPEARRLYPLLAALTANVTREMGCMSRTSKPVKRRLTLTPAGLSIDGQPTRFADADGIEELTVHDAGLIYGVTANGARNWIAFDEGGQLKEVGARLDGVEISCLEGLLPD